ncbi:MAG: hypothetical protein CMG11_01825 [Candidatus Marinimicrobia bacterium]|nr:hypothetical protein [Candidatus Neomarinimicrobiota bacterium]|tara:strand:- start:343 stop:3210 length:2868 start_codon:yes stop_codon:yes gene_type:complete
MNKKKHLFNYYYLYFFLILLMPCKLLAENIDMKNIDKNSNSATDLSWTNLTLDEKIGQMIMARMSGKFHNSSDYSIQDVKYLIQNYNVGGLIMFYGNVHGAAHNISLFQNLSKTPLLIASDYERGIGQWMSDGGTLFPSNMAVSATGRFSNAYEQGAVIAYEAKSLGVHLVLAPVLDINNNPKNPIINLRSYGDSPDVVSNYGLEFIKGIQDNDLLACAKHFPGHGNTDKDSHSSLPIISVDKKTINQNELIPFKNAIDNNVSSIMIGHLVVPSIDKSNLPATHSYKITTELLKQDLGFEGLVITDGLEMGALSTNISNEESIIRSIEAGADILLLPIDVVNAVRSIKSAIKSGRLKEQRIDQSVEKIWKMKAKLGLFSGKGYPDLESISNIVDIKSHKKIADKIAQESITLVKDDKNSVPIKPEKIDNLSHIILTMDDEGKDYLNILSKEIERTVRNSREYFVNYTLDDTLIENLINKVSNSDVIVISNLVRIRMDKGISTIDKTHLEFIQKLNQKSNCPIIAIGFGSPYLNSYDYIDAYLLTYGYGNISVKAAANALFGREDIVGTLPVDLNEKYFRGTGIKRTKRVSEFKKKANSKYNLESAISVINKAIDDEIFPGAQIFISKGEDVLLHSGFGKYSYELDAKLVDTSSVYDIASISKVVTTVPLVMKLVERRRISINNLVKEYYPSFTGGNKDKVKISHLLTHSSGISGYVRYFDMPGIANEQDILNDILDRDLKLKPGSKFEYSDLGFILLKNIIEKTNRSNFESLVSRWVLNPLKMRNTYYNPSSAQSDNIVPTENDKNFRKRLLKGEVHDENTYIMNGVSSHAGLFSNAWDLAIFAKLFLNKGVWLGKRHLGYGTVKKFLKKQNKPYGSDMALGWDTPSLSNSSAGDYFSNGSFGHLGFTGTSLWVDPQEEIIIVMLTNRVYPFREDRGIKKVRRDFHNEVMKEIIN